MLTDIFALMLTFIAKDLQDCMRKEGKNIATVNPGKPWKNGSNESLNGGFRNECLDAELFGSLMEAMGCNRRLEKALQSTQAPQQLRIYHARNGIFSQASNPRKTNSVTGPINGRYLR